MDPSGIWNVAAEWIAAIPKSGLLLAALAAMMLGIIGSFVSRRSASVGRGMRVMSTFGLAGVLVLVVLQVSRLDPRVDFAVPELGLPEQTVSGGETRVPLSQDGHFWVTAAINGEQARFLVDTGATLTALSTDTANAAALEPRRGGIPVQLKTANGTVNAQLTSIDSLRFGNIEANGLDAVIAPNLGDVNVVGMNFLSRLQSWRVEGQTLILTPAPDQELPVPEASENSADEATSW